MKTIFNGKDFFLSNLQLPGGKQVYVSAPRLVTVQNHIGPWCTWIGA